MKELKISQFGDPTLRQKARKLTRAEIVSAKFQQLIADMRHTLVEKKLGVALAAPQLGEDIALAVVAIRPTGLRPKIKPFDLVMINPEITETKGSRLQVWEGCISSGSNGKANLFAKVPRYKEVKVKYQDENGEIRTKNFTGLKVQIVQHESDHLEGTLFVDRVKDTKTYMTYEEYLRAKKNKLI